MNTGVAYFGNRMPKHVAADLQDIVEHGCSYVVHPFSENDWSFYHRTMREIFDLTHAAGLQAWVDPWSLGHVFGGEAFSRWVAEHPDQCQRDGDGRHLSAACLNQLSFRRFVHSWTDAALALAPDMVFWDEPHLFMGGELERGRWSCGCEVCRDLYQQRYGEPMPALHRDAGLQAFRTWTLLDFLSDVIGYSHSRGARNALCLFPEEVAPDPGPAWDDIAQISGLDNLGTDPYPFLPPNRSDPALPPTAASLEAELHPFSSRFEDWRPFVEGNARKIAGLTGLRGLDSHLWIQAFRIPAREAGYPEAAISIATAAGIGSVAAWGYDACAFMSWIACEQPAAIWQSIGRSFQASEAQRR